MHEDGESQNTAVPLRECLTPLNAGKRPRILALNRAFPKGAGGRTVSESALPRLSADDHGSLSRDVIEYPSR